ncbi:hypothetical protein [Candidatus Nitrospira nitrificans]|uniref:Uncharacterized protein n=1 Tax=Candidatus Nitrospira nitrificans TaxID=1742973 RepID=A0A0S4LJT6_9BACT|nr:hypothetical protein [Candidatus Nitrospira nitrificans]CUS37150.1 hypothetical protein COMA2_30101 [Candidatus Nitrospira nitrificans]
MVYEWAQRNRQALRPYVFASYLPILCFVGGAGVVPFVTVSQVLAHEDKNPYANFKTGEVTGIQGGGIQIDNANYTILSAVTITDQYENLVSLKDISQGERVLFHLDHKGRIDRLVLWVPS